MCPKHWKGIMRYQLQPDFFSKPQSSFVIQLQVTLYGLDTMRLGSNELWLANLGSYFKTTCPVFRAPLNTCACQGCPMGVIISHQMPVSQGFFRWSNIPRAALPFTFPPACQRLSPSKRAVETALVPH